MLNIDQKKTYIVDDRLTVHAVAALLGIHANTARVLWELEFPKIKSGPAYVVTKERFTEYAKKNNKPINRAAAELFGIDAEEPAIDAL